MVAIRQTTNKSGSSKDGRSGYSEQILMTDQTEGSEKKDMSGHGPGFWLGKLGEVAEPLRDI